MADNTMAISTYLAQDGVLSSIKSTLGDRTQQFTTSVISVTNSNKMLQNCDRRSILMACLTASSLDLPINQNLGFAYILPYKMKIKSIVNGKEVITWEDHAQFQAGYKAYIQLAQRSGQMKTINVSEVRQGEIVSIDRLTGEYKFSWIDEGRDALPIIGYVAYFELLNGFSKSLFLTKGELQNHGKKYSQTFKKGFGLWNDEFDSMAKKTVLKLLLSKYAPLSTQMATAIEADQAIIKEEGVYEYPDNRESEDPKEVAIAKERARVIKFIESTTDVDKLEEVELNLTDEELKIMYVAKKNKLLNELAK